MSGGDQRPTYAWLLSKWIEESGLTLRDLADRCAAAGHPITYSYISKVRAGKLPPASHDVTSALAAALGKDSGPLQALRMIEGLNGDWRELFWSLLSLLMDPTKPLPEQLEESRIRDLVVVLREVRRGQDLDFKHTDVAGRVMQIISTRLRMAMEPARDLAVLSLFDEVPNIPVSVWEGSWGTYTHVERKISRDADYALRVQESTMADVGVWPGDILCIKQGPEGLVSGDMVLARVRNQVVARRYYELPGSFRLEPALLAGAPIAPAEVEILGIVRGLIRAM